MKHALFSLAVVVTSALAVGAGACSKSDDSAAAQLQAMAKEARTQHGGGFHSAIPIIRVESLRKAQAYYRERLGFKVLWEDGDPPDFGAVKRGDTVYFMCERCQGRTGSWSFIFVEDVDKLYRELKDHNAIIKRTPQTEPWGLREMHVADPDGNVIRFASETDH